MAEEEKGRTGQERQDARDRLQTVGPQAGADPALPAISIGNEVHRYLILELLGKGGMGEVYKAYDPKLDRPIALKLISASSDSAVLREAQALAQLSHQNVVQVYDVGVYGSSIFIAMELVEGRTLRQWLTETTPRPSRKEVLRVLLEAGAGLVAAHQAGLVHRDVKPENIMVGEGDRVWVLDFGLARAIEGDVALGAERLDEELMKKLNRALEAASSTSTPFLKRLRASLDSLRRGGVREEATTVILGQGTVSGASTASPGLGSPSSERIEGTLFYMAPEQYCALGGDKRTDQFSFAVVAFEALYGCRPFVGETPRELLEQIVHGQIAVPVRLAGRAAVPSGVRRVLQKGLSVKPADRYPSMEAFIHGLSRDPARIRRRALLAVLLVILLGGVALWLSVSSTGRDKVCRDTALLAERSVWSPEAAAFLRARFEKDKGALVGPVWNATARGIQGYLEQWRELFVEACVATRIRGEQSEEMFQLRSRCLESKLLSLRSLIAALKDAAGASLERAPFILSKLPWLPPCANLEALRASVAPLPEPGVRGQVAEIQALLGRAWALGETGRPDEGLARAREALALAGQLGVPSALAEALYRLGCLQQQKGDLPAAEGSLREARRTAESRGLVELRARATNRLTALLGQSVESAEEAEWMGAYGQAILERMGGDESLKSELYESLGQMERGRGALDRAQERFRQALSIREKIYGKVHLAVAESLRDLGETLRLKGEEPGAEDALQRAARIEESESGRR